MSEKNAKDLSNQEMEESMDKKKETSEEEKAYIRELSIQIGYPYEWLLELYEGGELREVKW